MSYLSEEIQRQLLKSDQSIDDIVSKSDLTRSLLYLWKNGEQTSITEEQLRALAPALSSDPADHASLVLAHLQDERVGPGSELVEVSIMSAGLLKDAPRPRSKGEQALQYLAQERVHNRDLNDLLIDLARVLGWVDKADTRKPAGKARRNPKTSPAGLSPSERQ